MKKLIWIGIILLALVIAVLGAGGITRGIFSSRYEAEIAAIKAKGEPVTAADLVGKPISPDENGAVVYKKVFALLDSGKYDTPGDTLDKFGTTTPRDPALVKEAQRALVQVRPVLDLVGEAASRPKCRFDRDWSAGASAMLFPEYARLRHIARMIWSASVLRAMDGSMDESFRYVELGFRNADSLRDEPALISLLVREAMIMITSKAMKDSLAYGDLTEEQARRLFDILGKTDLTGSYVHALEGERVVWLTEMVKLPGDAIGFVAIPDRYHGSRLFDPASKVLGFGYRHVVDKGDQAAWLQFMAEQIENARLDYPTARSKGVFRNRSHWPAYAPMGKLAGDSSGDMHFTLVRNRSRVAMDQVFLALQGYKARYGGYPASMKELKARLGWKLPRDPFSEKDFIYKQQAKGFILYSVGPDMKDDGGRKISGDHVEVGSKGDIVLVWDK